MPARLTAYLIVFAVSNLAVAPPCLAQAAPTEELFRFSPRWTLETFRPKNLLFLIEGETVPLPNLPEGARPLRVVRIPSGTFVMGSTETERGHFSDEGPQHEVLIPSEFYMTETEITQAQWKAVMGGFPNGFPASGPGVGDDFPMFGVSWDDIEGPGRFLIRLGLITPGFRLPTEAEWEHACRAGTQTRFSFGDVLACDDRCEDCTAEAGGTLYDHANLCRDVNGWEEVGSLLPNGFGLFDMHGNVFEWVRDEYHSTYQGAPTDGTAWEDGMGTGGRVIRGGDWLADPMGARAAFRNGMDPALRDTQLGFRLVYELPG